MDFTSYLSKCIHFGIVTRKFRIILKRSKGIGGMLEIDAKEFQLVLRKYERHSTHSEIVCRCVLLKYTLLILIDAFQ